MTPLFGIAAATLPDIVRLVASDKSGQLADKVAKVVSDTVGVSDPARVKSRLSEDPAIEANLQQKLAELALEETKAQYDEADKQRQSEVDDTESARNSLLSMAKVDPKIAWTPPIVSYAVILGFFVFLILIIRYRPGAGATPNDLNTFALINISVGALTAAFATVVNFWLGSSHSSQTKSEQINARMNADALSEKGPVVQAPAPQQRPAEPAMVPRPVLATGVTAASKAAAPNDAPDRFQECLPHIFQVEGGFCNVHGDPGGPTKYGITLETLKEWEGKCDLMADDVQNLQKETAAEIYRTNYWNKMQCGALPKGVDLEVFDFGVNAGPSRAVKLLQKVVGVEQDGSVGPVTLAAVRICKPQDLVARFSKERLDYYHSLANAPQFEKGWTARANEIESAALKMAA